MSRPLRILFAPDSFKGSLTSVEVARALADGWARARPDDEIVLCPLADGGEGTLEAIAAAGGWAWQTATVDDPLGRPIEARWLATADGRRAVVEMAEASGLSRVAAAERDPVRATSRRDRRADPGRDRRRGHLDRARDRRQRDDRRRRRAAPRARGARPIATGPSPASTASTAALAEVDLAVACDVTNPLLGPSGAAAIYGPQKGATPGRRRRARSPARSATPTRSRRRPGARVRDVPGAGAAGGIGFALLAIGDRFRSFALRPGRRSRDGGDRLRRHAWRAPTSSSPARAGSTPRPAFGKTALGVARRAADAGVPCIAVGGGVEPEGIEALRAVGAVAVPVVERPQSVEAAMAAGTAPVARCGERLAAVAVAAVAVARPRSPRSSDGQPDAQPAGDRASATSRTPARTWAKRLERRRPGLVPFVLDELAGLYGHPAWQRRLDPTSELILTILTQNSADIERRGRVRGAADRATRARASRAAPPGRRLGRRRAARRRRARLGRDRVRAAPRAGRDDPAGRPAATRRRRASRPRCARSARSAATTRSSSSATCPRSRRATG